MSLRTELIAWSKALKAYDAQDYEAAIETFDTIGETSRIQFNLGLIHATLGRHEKAVECFRQAYGMDSYLAVAYFQSGVSNFLLQRFEDALVDFQDAYTYLRQNTTIDYEQLGLKFRLCSCEVLFNRGLCQLNLGRENAGLVDIAEAGKEKQNEEHSVIDDALNDRAEGYTVFSIPVGTLYRPSENKLRNLATKNYLGAAKLVAVVDGREAFTGFAGAAKAALQQIDVRGPMGDGGPKSAPEGPTANPFDVMKRRPSDATTAFRPSPGVRSPPSSPLKPRVRSSSLVNGVRPFQPVSTSPLAASPPRLGGNQNDLPLTPPDSRKGDDYEDLDDVYEGYADGVENVLFEPEKQPPEGQTPGRVADWARSQADTSPLKISRAPSSIYSKYQSRQPLQRQPETVPPLPALPLRNNSATSASGEGSPSSRFSEERIRIKLHYNQSVRGMSISPFIGYQDFVDLVSMKFAKQGLQMQFKDEDTMVDILDESDFDSALLYSKDEGNKLSIYLED